MKARTVEEKFLLAAHDAALLIGDEDSEVNRYIIGQSIGLNPRGINTTCNVLAQANFIKKRGEENIIVTQQGRELIKVIAQ